MTAVYLEQVQKPGQGMDGMSLCKCWLNKAGPFVVMTKHKHTSAQSCQTAAKTSRLQPIYMSRCTQAQDTRKSPIVCKDIPLCEELCSVQQYCSSHAAVVVWNRSRKQPQVLRVGASLCRWTAADLGMD